MRDNLRDPTMLLSIVLKTAELYNKWIGRLLTPSISHATARVHLILNKLRIETTCCESNSEHSCCIRVYTHADIEPISSRVGSITFLSGRRRQSLHGIITRAKQKRGQSVDENMESDCKIVHVRTGPLVSDPYACFVAEPGNRNGCEEHVEQ